MVHLFFIFFALLALLLGLLVDINLTPAQTCELSEFSVREVFDTAYYITVFVQQFLLMDMQGHCVLKCCFTCFYTDYYYFFLLLRIITTSNRIPLNNH